MSEGHDALSTRYLEAWSRKDLKAIAACLHADVDFKSPTATTKGRDDFLAATRRFFPLIQRLDIRARFTRGDQAMFAYDFVCIPPIGVCPTAELLGFEEGLIRRSEIFFDARPFEALQRASAAGLSK